MKIFCDIDGVLGDFWTAALAAHGIEDCPYDLPTYRGVYHGEKALGFTPEIFWSQLQGRTFWTGIKPYDHAVDVVRVCEEHVGQDNVALMTSPSRDEECATGKMAWIKQYFPAYVRRTIITPVKHLCAHDQAVLVDDHPGNVASFRGELGRAILFPAPWNANYKLLEHAVEFLRASLEQHL